MMFLVTFQSVTVTNVVREVMLLLSLFREVTTTCYGFTGKERRLSTKVRVPEKKNKCAIMVSYVSMLCPSQMYKI